MSKLWVVTRREYLERVRSKWFIIATLLGPVFFGAITILPIILGARTKGSADVSHIVILDATGSDLGTRVSGMLAGGISGDTSQATINTSQATIIPVAPTALAAAESTALHDVMSGANAPLGYLVLDSVKLAHDSAYYAGRNASSLLDVDRIEGAVRQSVLAQRLEREGLQPSHIEALTKINLKMSTDRITKRGRQGSGIASTVFAYIIGFLLYMMLALYGQQILRGVMEEKTTRVAEVVVSSAPTDTLLAGKVIGVGGASLTQMVAWILLTIAVFEAKGPLLARAGLPNPNIPLPGITASALILLVVFFVFGFALYASLCAAMGATINSAEDVQQAAMPVFIPLIVAIVLIQPILLNPTSTMAKVASWIPLTAPILMPVRMTMTQIPWFEIAATLAGIALTCAAAVWAAARIYRVGLLMYGKRPTFAELARWVREA